MKQNFKILIILLISIKSFGQIQIDTLNHIVITTPIYTSYYSETYHVPEAVTYILYKGGGETSRKGYRFENKAPFRHNFSYAKTGFDRGHMVPAKDFSHSATDLRMTFKYYNCAPQTPSLNRGKWKSLEFKVRKRSQTDSLLIICYNSFGDKTIGQNPKIYVPDTCYKIVYVIKNGKLKLEKDLSKCFPNVVNPVILEIDNTIIQKTYYFINYLNLFYVRTNN